MFNSTPLPNRFAICITLFAVLTMFASAPALAQDEEAAADREEAVRLINENKYLEALPILERIILSYPDDAELWAQFGIAIISNSVVLSTIEERKEEQARGIKALKRAQQLGTENERALDLLDQFEGADGSDNFETDNPEVEKALREGEAFFGRGDYDNAFKSYEKAHKIDPKNYEAVLFMGDCFYAQKRYAEAVPYFEKAVAIDPDREMAYRFWGDALLYQEKFAEAREKFIEAVIADPYSRMVWSSLREWAEATESSFEFYEIVPPGNEIGGTITIDAAKLSADDGSIHWKEYDKTLLKLAAAAKDGEANSPTFTADIAAWKSVADAFRKDLKAGKIKYPDSGLVNLLRISDEGLLESYILLLRPYEHFGDDYQEYRKQNKARIRIFLIKYVLYQDN